MSMNIESPKMYATFPVRLKKVMGLVGLLAVVGCQSGLYQISTSEDEKKELDVKFQYYDVADASKPTLEPNQVCHPEKMAVTIIKGKEVRHPDEPGISGMLWMFTLGVFPMCQSSYLEGGLEVVTPLGKKHGTYRLDAKNWIGWIPMFIGYPASADMRVADADIKSISGMKLRQKLETKLVDSLVRQFSYDEYLSYAKKRNDDRQAELKRIAVAESNVVALIEKGDFDQAQDVCDKEFGGESEMKNLVAKKKADFTRQIAQKKEEERIAKRKEELRKLMAESKFIEVVTIAREEKLKSEKSFGRPNFELWDGYETDATKAIKKQEADSGDAEAKYLYALELSNARDDVEAYKYFKSAADRGYGLAFREVGLGYECGFAGVTNKDEAAKWYKRFVGWAQSKEGERNARGQYLLGLSYQEGRGVTESSIDAFGAYKRAAELGHQDAKVEVARCYLDGYGVKKDEVEAAILMEPLAEGGHPEAQRLLGVMCQKGLGMSKDIDKAIAWFEKAAAQGCVKAIYGCGSAWLKKVDAGYHYGIAPLGKSSIYDMSDELSAKPEEWFLKAAREDYVPAWWALGFLYERHFKGKRQDEGLKWMVKAAQKGYVKAIRSLATGYGHERFDDEDARYRRAYWGLKYLAIDAALTDSKWVKWVSDSVKRLDEDMEGRKLLRKVRAQIVAEGGVDVTSEEYQNERKSKIAERLKGLLAKSKTAAQGKFCLKGFYLGMSIADAKDLISCYLPESAIQIGQDKTLAKGKVGQCMGIDVVLVGERGETPMYFCQADENGVVYRFNFPKKLLSQFFKYGTSSYGNWAKCFADEHKMSLHGSTVFDEWEMEGVGGWQTQDVYEWQDLEKGIRVAYFGKHEEKMNGSVDEVLRSKTPYQIGKIAGFGNVWIGRWLNSKGAEEGTLRVERIRE